MSRFVIWGMMCLALSAAFLANAARIALRRRRFIARADAAGGTVVAVRVDGIGRNAVSIPTFEFRTAAGALQRAESLQGSGLRGFTVGETVPILYDPDDPARAEVAAFAVLWGLAILRGSFGVAFLVMGLVGLLVS